MYKCKVKLFLLSFGVLLFLATTSFGWEGPCFDSIPCGGFGGACELREGMGTCGWTNGDCSGNCALCCVHGDNEEYCAGWYIPFCNESEVHCTEMMSRTCTISGGGCACPWPIETDGWCWRQNC